MEELGRQALIIEEHYGRPMDIEWGKDGVDGELYILQARPETVVSRVDGNVMRRFVLEETGVVAAEGRAIGQKIGAGPVRVMKSIAQMDQFQAGDVLVADMTDPDWEPIMKLASAIVTNRGGRTCHAAIIARELGIPAVVGTGDATRVLVDGQEVTVSCAEGDTGFVYQGILEVRGAGDPAGRDAREPGEDHAQRRNARPGVLVLQAPQPRASGWRGSSSSSTGRSASTPARCSNSTRSPRRCATRSPSGSAPTRPRASTS